MSKDEALKMAIETFDWEKVNKKCNVDILTMVMDFSNGRINASDLMDAIAYRCQATLELACKEALNIANCDLKQPAQEASEQAPCEQPVAWLLKLKLGNTERIETFVRFTDADGGQPLYTHPAQPWQGITEDDFREAHDSEFRWGAAWAEQILQERNHGR
jgi:hypothetical protein